jgi:hypothetical protein
MSFYTHNLKILLVDNYHHKIIEDTDLLEEIKSELQDKSITQFQEYNGETKSYDLCWKREPLNPMEHHFMGDLFLVSDYDNDKVYYDHTMMSLTQIETKIKGQRHDNNWTILFHISRRLDYRT